MSLLMKCVVLTALSLYACGTHAQSWQLAWSDEFDGSIGPGWVFETGNGSGGWGNNELQYYRRENATIENNALVITAKREDFGGYRYTSARMKTQGVRNFRYGRIEARMRLPSFMGAWPAFWMLGSNLPQVGWPDSGEIDVMEHVNNEDRTYGTIHWRDHNGNYAQYSGDTAVTVQEWHVYAVEWDANAIRWYVDGNKFHEASIQNSVNGTEEFHRDHFLLLNFAIYLAIPILHARRREPALRDPVDGTLVFGTPLVCFALQAALLDGERMPLAYSALVLALVYALLAWWQLPRRRVLGESYAVLAAGFATLAVPLALSARSTACTFALEGAALVWLGLRQRRLLPEASGWILQALAAGAFLFASIDGTAGSTPVANATCISALLIAAAAFASAWLYWRAGTRPQPSLLVYLWGLAWWIGAGLREIDRFVPASAQAAALLAFAATTAALAGFAFVRTRAGAPAWTAAVGLAAGNLLVLAFAQSGARPFEGWGLAAFAACAAGGLFSLRSLASREDFAPRVAHIGWLWCWSFAAALALHQYARDAGLASGWIAGATWLPLLLAWVLALLRPAWIAAPLHARFDEWRGALLLTQAALAALLFVVMLAHAGDTAPIAFVPLLNPVELLQFGAIVCAMRWLADRDAPDGLATSRSTLLSLAGFALVTAATLRAVHQLGGVPWDEGMLDSHLAQTALTVVWSVLGVLGWVLGSRRGQRALWLAGAVLMAVVLAKLLLVDRGHLGNLFGIVSFIAYGLLCTVIGYVAPAPPRATAQETA